MFYLIYQSVSPYRLHMHCILSGLIVFRACVTMIESLSLGQLLWLPKLWGLLLIQQHLRYMTWFRFLSPLDLSCLGCRVKSLAGNQAPSNYWLNGGYCMIDSVISFSFHSFFLLHSLEKILVVWKSCRGTNMKMMCSLYRQACHSCHRPHTMQLHYIWKWDMVTPWMCIRHVNLAL